jgi:hypothetical protein
MTLFNSEELALSERISEDGLYEIVLDSGKQLANGLKPVFSCPQLIHPLWANLPKPLADLLYREGKGWCRKIQKTCPTNQIVQDML